MALLGKYKKQPGEILDYDMDYSEWFSNRTDLPLSSYAVAEAGITLVSFVLIGKVIKVTLAGGVDGSTYKVTTRLTTDSGIIREGDFAVTVREV